MMDLRKPTTDEITRVAYALYLLRGCGPGSDVEDWVKAEKELADRPIEQPQAPRAARPARPVWFDKSSNPICG
jgi:hypothetical protein